MAKKYSECTHDVIHLAEELISKYHPLLAEANIAFVFQDEATESAGRFELSKTSKVPLKMKVYMEYDFLIVIAEDKWIMLSSKAQEATIDHELCHCGGDVDNGWKIRHHDIEEFRVVLERHGAWSKDLREDLQPVMQNGAQPTLPGVESVEFSSRGKVVTLTGQQLGVLARSAVELFKDELLEDVRKLKSEVGGALTTTIIQHKFNIGYPRAAALMDLIKTAEAADEPIQ